MSTFDCNFEEFKRRAKEFNDAVPSLDYDELENAYKALGLSYLGMHEEMWQHSAAVVLKMMLKVYVERQTELDMQGYASAAAMAKDIDRSILDNILVGEQVVEDFGGYEESTMEKYQAFAAARNYKLGQG